MTFMRGESKTFDVRGWKIGCCLRGLKVNNGPELSLSPPTYVKIAPYMWQDIMYLLPLPINFQPTSPPYFTILFLIILFLGHAYVNKDVLLLSKDSIMNRLTKDALMNAKPMEEYHQQLLKMTVAISTVSSQR